MFHLQVFDRGTPRGTTGFRISSMAAKILESGIWNLNFHNILVKLCIYPYIVNHVIWIALFGIQESLESSQESWNQARNRRILPRFQKIPNYVEENS